MPVRTVTATDHPPRPAAVAIVADLARALRESATILRDLATMPDNNQVLQSTYLELPALSGALDVCGRDVERSMAQLANVGADRSPDADSNEPIVRAILGDLFQGLLQGHSGAALTNMLRLWQVIETYCRISEDLCARRLGQAGAAYSEQCLRIQRDLATLGLTFHPVRFLHPLPGHGGAWPYTVTPHSPIVQKSRQLTVTCLRHIGEYNGLIADVSRWGFDCRLNRELTAATTLSCWWL